MMTMFSQLQRAWRVGTVVSALGFFAVSPAQSALITDNITGADMAGIEVEAFYGSGSDTAIWTPTSTDASVPEGEGFAGEAAGNGWTLSQQGFTLGNVSIVNPGQIIGLWTFTNFFQAPITGFQVRGLPGSIVFDIIGPDGPEVTPGSDVGRPFTPEADGIAMATYDDPFSGTDLFGTLNVSFSGAGLDAQQQFSFLIDTDAVSSVPLPTTSLLLGVGLALSFAGFGRRSAA